MHDPIAAGRRAALRAVAFQVAVAGLVAVAFLAQGPRHAVAAGIGGGALALGNALAARLSLAGIAPARVAFSRLMLGVLAKWSIAFAVFAVALEVWRLPPLPMLLGLAAGLLAYLLALNFPGSRRTSTNRNSKGQA